jgi:hypothetical protein
MAKNNVINRIIHDTIESNLVYPNWTNKDEYLILGKLDKDYVKYSLKQKFNVNSINNKYAINICYDILWYQHDMSTFILKKIQ